MDGVVADFESAICQHYGLDSPFLLKENWGKFDMAEIWGMDALEFLKPCGHAFYEGLAKLPDADEIFQIVCDKFGEKNVCFLSTPTPDPGSLSGKLAWIQKHFPSHKRQYCFCPKKYFAAHRNAILIDDYDNNVSKFVEHGGGAILYPRLWNSNYPLLSYTKPADYLRSTLYDYFHHHSS